MQTENFTVKEAAERSRMSESWWRQVIASGEIEVIRIGRKVFVPGHVIEKIINSGTEARSNKK